MIRLKVGIEALVLRSWSPCAHVVILYLGLLLPLTTLASVGIENTATDAEEEISAKREIGQSFEQARDLALGGTPEGTLAPSTVLKSARYYHADLDASALPSWGASDEALFDLFEGARDQRLYFEAVRPDFPRRATWLHPDDGCYARAPHMARHFSAEGHARPGQAFAFGSLRMKTKYEPGGVVAWWYHVAPAFRVGDEVVVLDPSVDSSRPLPLRDWLAKFSKDPAKVKVSLCDPNAYSPRSYCRGGKRVSDKTAISQLRRYLPREWNTLARLRLNPTKILGDEPPWKFLGVTYAQTRPSM